jgi:membrane protein
MLRAIGHSHGRGRQSLLRFQATGLAMTLCAAVAAVLAIAILVALPHALRIFAPGLMLRSLIHTASYAILIGFVGLSITALYRFGPSPGTNARILPGAIAATALWLTTSILFSIYVSRVVPLHTTYGPLTAVAAVMLWFWVSTYVVLLGAELNAALGVRT